MSPHWEAHTGSESVDVGTVIRLYDAIPPAPQLMGQHLSLTTLDGVTHGGVVGAAMPGLIVVRLPDNLVYLVPAGTQQPPAGDNRAFTSWVVQKIEHNLDRDIQRAESRATFDEIDTETPDGEQIEQNLAEGQLPGMPVSRDVLREPGPTPAPLERPVRD